MILEIFSFIVVISFVFFFFKKQWHQFPPSPKVLPIIGHLHLLGHTIHKTFHDLSCHYGDLFYFKLGSVSCIVASSPELAKELLKTQLAFSSRNTSLAINYLTYNASFAFAPYGPYWKFIKKWSSFELLGNRMISQSVDVRTKELNYFLGILYNKSKVDESVNISQELIKLSNNIINQMIWSIRSSETDDQATVARNIVREVTQIFGQFNVCDFFWFCRNLDLQGFRKRYVETRKRYDELVEKIVGAREHERKKNKSNGVDHKVKDFLDVMLDLMEDENAEMKITRDHLKALIFDFFIAGTDTTAILLEWALAELINNPKVLEKAQEEIDKVVGNIRIVQESDTPNLPYIQAIIKETFRLHPPIPMVTRKSIHDCKVNGYIIPAHTNLFVNVWSIGRNPKYWENPLQFQPERFLRSNESSNSIDVRGQHFELLPFGTGRRICPGIPLAMQELPTTLAATIQCFDLKVINPSGVKINGNDVLDMTERPGLTAPRAHDLVCIPVARIPYDKVFHFFVRENAI